MKLIELLKEYEHWPSSYKYTHESENSDICLKCGQKSLNMLGTVCNNPTCSIRAGSDPTFITHEGTVLALELLNKQLPIFKDIGELEEVMRQYDAVKYGQSLENWDEPSTPTEERQVLPLNYNFGDNWWTTSEINKDLINLQKEFDSGRFNFFNLKERVGLDMPIPEDWM